MFLVGGKGREEEVGRTLNLVCIPPSGNDLKRCYHSLVSSMLLTGVWYTTHLCLVCYSLVSSILLTGV